MSAWRRLAAGEFDMAAAERAAADLGMSGVVAALEHADRVLAGVLWVTIVGVVGWVSWQCLVAASGRGRKPPGNFRH